MHEYGFEKLKIWQLAVAFSVKVYQLTATYPSEEKFGIVNQLRRALTSISANIAEGYARVSKKEKARFLGVAYGSLMEALSFLLLSKELAYLDEEQLFTFRKGIGELSNKIKAYYN